MSRITLWAPKLGTEAERYRRGQRSSEDDQERRRRKLHRYAKLGERREGRVDDRVARYVREKVTPCRPRTMPARKLTNSAAGPRIRIAAIMLGM
jgi:hypothetical protein